MNNDVFFQELKTASNATWLLFKLLYATPGKETDEYWDRALFMADEHVSKYKDKATYLYVRDLTLVYLDVLQRIVKGDPGR